MMSDPTRDTPNLLHSMGHIRKWSYLHSKFIQLPAFCCLAVGTGPET